MIMSSPPAPSAAVGGHAVEQGMQQPKRNIATDSKIVVAKPSTRRIKQLNSVPDEILHDDALNAAISLLPENYKFEIHKSVWKIRTERVTTVALQFPEGLLMYACIISDILGRFTGANVIILGDVTYGACCIDDFTAKKLGAQMLIHYGHSCLVPINTTKIKVMYVFVEIQFDTAHLIEVVRRNFSSEQRIALMGTIQFAGAVHEARNKLKDAFPHLLIPQAKPLSPGETLGCTAPQLTAVGCEALIFVADGRFHLEAAMIQNPTVQSYRYDPYAKAITREKYDTGTLKRQRWDAITQAREGRKFGVILGTLGRQGNPLVYDRITKLLRKHGKRYVQFLMAEIQPAKLLAITDIDAWIQVACPRLSIDWGSALEKPLLTAYEVYVALGEVQYCGTSEDEAYPMDYYSKAGGAWTNYSTTEQNVK